jgi:SAM-dependent methyltransferase
MSSPDVILDRTQLLLGPLRKFNSSLGWVRRLQGINYVRSVELPVFASFVLQLGCGDYLDVGTGDSILPTFIALNSTYRVTVIDKFDWVQKQKQYLQRLGESELLVTGRFNIRQEDFLTADIPKASFDVITALSVLEHVANDGDMEAIRKIHSLLRTGGYLLTSSPYNRDMAADFYVKRAVYGEEPGLRGAFFQRHYSKQTFEERVLRAAPFEVKRLFYAGHYNRPNVYKHFYALPGPVKPVKALYAWATAAYAPRVLRLSTVPPCDSNPRMVTADTVFALLRKPS